MKKLSKKIITVSQIILLTGAVLVNPVKTASAEYYDDYDGVLEYYDDPYGSLQDYCEDYGDDLDGYCDDYIDDYSDSDYTTPSTNYQAPSPGSDSDKVKPADKNEGYNYSPKSSWEITWEGYRRYEGFEFLDEDMLTPEDYFDYYRSMDLGVYQLPSGEMCKPIPRDKIDYKSDDERYQVTDDDHPQQGLAVGDKLENGETIEEFYINTEKTIPEIAREYKNDKDALYELAIDSSNENVMLVEDRGSYECPVRANEKTQNDFNQERFIDMELLNEEFIKLLNQDRLENGLEEVTYLPDLQEGTNNRAADLASIGNIMVGKALGRRLDGSYAKHDFDYYDKDGEEHFTECRTVFHYSGNPYELVSEKALAKNIYFYFNDWKSLMSDEYTQGALSIKIGHYNTSDGNQYNSMVAVFTRLDD